MEQDVKPTAAVTQLQLMLAHVRSLAVTDVRG